MTDDIIVLCVDALRADRLLSTPAVDVDTPNLDGLLDRGTLYTNAFSSATTTNPAVTSLLSGSYPPTTGVQSLGGDALSDEAVTVADILGASGYETHAHVTGPLDPRIGLADRFDEYHYRDPERDLTTDWKDEVIDHIERVQSSSTPTFSYLHFWELHWRCTIPDEPNPYPNEVDYALEYFDDLVADVLDAIDFDETLVVFTADHGESMPQTSVGQLTGYVLRRIPRRPLSRNVHRFRTTHKLSRAFSRVVNAPRNTPEGIHDRLTTRGHGYHVLDYLTHVPLLVADPEVAPGTVDAQVRLADIVPTLLERCGVDCDPGLFDGDPLPETGEETGDRYAYMQASGGILEPDHYIEAVRSPDDWKYLRFRNSEKLPPELYDVGSDPLEVHDVIDHHPDVAKRLRDVLDGIKSDSNRTTSRQSVDDMASIEDTLEDLGYI